ncbi:MAG: tryptophan synthase subunit alpha, partial [Bacteroidales bacterium]
MNRIKQLFQIKKSDVLSVYITAGYPSLDSTVELIKKLEKDGVDMIEIGVPYSDPLADGPVIQRSSQIALENGMSISLLFEQLAGIRDSVKIPLLIMSYFNPILVYGFEKFCAECKLLGIDGLIIPDLPFEEYSDKYKLILEKYGLEFILLITPQTSEQRIRQIDDCTDSFIYMVSSASTTGRRDSFSEEQALYFNRVSEFKLKNPCLIGFGVSNRNTYEMACKYANGVIVGSRFIDMLSEGVSVDIAIRRL